MSLGTKIWKSFRFMLMFVKSGSIYAKQWSSNTFLRRKCFVLWYLSGIIREGRMSQRQPGHAPVNFKNIKFYCKYYKVTHDPHSTANWCQIQSRPIWWCKIAGLFTFVVPKEHWGNDSQRNSPIVRSIRSWPICSHQVCRTFSGAQRLGCDDDCSSDRIVHWV